MSALLSLNVGKPTSLNIKGKTIQTGIYKNPINHKVFLNKTGLDGDGQADLVHHGGVEKAVCVYPFEHYRFWEEKLGISLKAGAFGENITSLETLEEQVHIGDVYEFGEAVLQVSQPRQPCFKLSQRYGVRELPLMFQQTGYTGFYFRVIKEGYVSNKSTLRLVETDSNLVSVSFANKIMHLKKDDLQGINRILKVKGLSINWRNTLENRQKGLFTNDTLRLNGE